MSHVFISYKTEDRWKAQSVRMALRAELGCEVWWDQDLQTGGQWSQEMDAALSSAACVVVLWSKLSVQSQWVQQEAAVAKALGILAPAQIDDCVIPPPYAGIQAARLINWQGNEKDPEFAKLASRVQVCLVNHSSSRLPSSQLPSPPASALPRPRQVSLGEPIGADARKNLRSRIENNIALWSLSLLLAGFLAGFGVYGAILKIAKLETVPSSTIAQLKAEIKNLKEEKAALETQSAKNSLSPPPQDLNERVLFYKEQILSLRGDIEARSSNTQDTVRRKRGLQLASLIGEIDAGQLRPAIKIIQHEYRGWAFLMAVSTYDKIQTAETPPEDIPAMSRIGYATKAVAEFDLALDLMDDITRDYKAGVAAATPIYEWMTGPDSEDLNRTHYLKAIALAVIARAGGGSPQAAIDELSKIQPTYLVDTPAKNNPDLAWALQQLSMTSNRNSADH